MSAAVSQPQWHSPQPRSPFIFQTRAFAP